MLVAYTFQCSSGVKMERITKETRKDNLILAGTSILIVIMGILIHYPIRVDSAKLEEKADIYFIWKDGQRIFNGKNPYERILGGNMRENNKYSTMFPPFYLSSALLQLVGVTGFRTGIELIRLVFLVFNIGTGVLIFYSIFNAGSFALGLFGAVFWFGSRWSLRVTEYVYSDAVPIFFLIASLILFNRNRFLSLLLLSISLCFKHLGILIIPLFLIQIYLKEQDKKAIKVIISSLIIISIPIIFSIPFLIWNFEGFIKSILFSVTRYPDTNVVAQSLDYFLSKDFPKIVGIMAKVPMLLLMSLIYFEAFRQKVSLYFSSFLIMVVFINFNSVLFFQYILWTTALLPLALSENVKFNTNRDLIAK
jgi:hypothetical protein